jgi:hypothetical protein
MSVSALYLLTPTAVPVPCTVRPWLKNENMAGDLPGFAGVERAEPEDRIRFELSEVPAPRRNALVSVEPGEAYRIDHLYPVDLGYQTARVVRLSAADTAALPVPE